jgi:hypothetical protein
MPMPLRRKAAAMPAALLCAALLAACTTSEASPQPKTTPRPSTTSAPRPTTEAPPVPELVQLKVDRGRQSPGVVAAGGRDAPYNYGPSVMVDGGRYRMWWCSQLGVANPPGDDILLAESTSLDGGFAGPDGTPGTPVLSGSGGGFDAMHVCDPSVVKAGGVYYLYYTGSAGDHLHGNTIGVATSLDGRVWTRANGGRPIVLPARNVINDNPYGAGQPAAVYLDGWFYLMFTDTTGRDVGWNGAGQFVLRSTDPTFGSHVETLSPGGFRSMTDTASRFHSVVDAFSADLMWVDALNAFAIAHETDEGTTITFWDKDFRVTPYRPIVVAGPWREGPGLVRRSDGHAIVPVDAACDTVPIDLVRGTRQGAAGPTDLRHFGIDVVQAEGCHTTSRALNALIGFAMPSPARTIDLLIAGKLVRVDRRSVAEVLGVRFLDHRVPALDGVTPTAELTVGLPAVRAPGRGIGLVMNDKLWLLPSPAVAERNSSPIRDISAAAWDLYERGPDLVAPPA